MDDCGSTCCKNEAAALVLLRDEAAVVVVVGPRDGDGRCAVKDETSSSSWNASRFPRS